MERIVVSDRARLLHSRAVIANLHSDFAMFHRDLTRASQDGVSDFPRMREAGIDLVGILAQTQFLGGEHLATVADHLLRAIRVGGIDHVGLGLDMEEVMVRVLPAELRDVRDLPKLTELLFERGLAAEDIEKVLGLNFLRFFERALEPRPSS